MRQIIVVKEKQLDDLTNLAIKLWPENDFEELKNEYTSMLKTHRHRAFLYIVDNKPVGFVQLSIRTDYVEGSDSSPVGYVEGIYVEPQYRRQGISKELLVKGEQWVKEKGCTQIGSDIEYNNTTSYHFHKGIGFKEVNRLICFIKDINE